MSNKYKIFFIMPFDTEFDQLYTHMKEVIETENAVFEVFRADNLLNQQNILKDIVLAINNSDLIIADLTDLNPNVFYELGLAHALRKDVILLTQQLGELPFDLRSYRVISYSTNFKKIEELDANLKRMLNEILNGQLSFGSPITDWLPKDSINIQPNNFKAEDLNSYESEIIEEGFLDFISNLDESIEKLTAIIDNISMESEIMAEGVTRQTKEIEISSNNRGSGSISRVRKLTRKASSIMNEYGLFIAKQNQIYELQWTQFEENITNLFNSRIIQNEIGENEKTFLGFLETLMDFKVSILPAVSALQALVTEIANLHGIESTMNRAAALIEKEFEELIDLLETSVATLDRLYIMGFDIIKKETKTI